MLKFSNLRNAPTLIGGIGIAACLALLSFFAIKWVVGSGRPTTPTIENLPYPVVVLFSSGTWSIAHNSKDLTTMSMQRVLMLQTSPKLVDNSLNLFQLDNLNSTLSSFQLMATAGNGLTPVSFELNQICDESHLAAKALLSSNLASSLSVHESQQLGDKIRSSETLEDALLAISETAAISAIP